jgi:hypothetical protein
VATQVTIRSLPLTLLSPPPQNPRLRAGLTAVWFRVSV